jgi:hypothetical protein
VNRALSIVNRANQRGGRMLSVVDLLEAGTFSLARAAWLAFLDTFPPLALR